MSEEETTTRAQQAEDKSSDDFDEDEDESEEPSDDDDDGDKPRGLSRFLVDQDSSESEEEDVEATTKVKSAKDKRHDELEATITGIQNGQKINDWHLIANGGCALVLEAGRNTDIGRRVR